MEGRRTAEGWHITLSHRSINSESFVMCLIVEESASRSCRRCAVSHLTPAKPQGAMFSNGRSLLFLRTVRVRTACLRTAFLRTAFLRTAFLRTAFLRTAFLRTAFLRTALLLLHRHRILLHSPHLHPFLTTLPSCLQLLDGRRLCILLRRFCFCPCTANCLLLLCCTQLDELRALCRFLLKLFGQFLDVLLHLVGLLGLANHLCTPLFIVVAKVVAGFAVGIGHVD
ncbi:hypothetical protein BDY17DRAFT_336378 [Neohortaea acidophila]|uniref:Uncharacterized protein n=1 Tax=Neohortaea acidophila TaxID=245834 RepID=A0A6A6PPL2_9PEZI|nr:uncharacterized protein BDY17DRAFT_336378 [Neohortaea acidophila]KAF2481564.1 hypothetical protein BDY17DRAFT_336378 [Neohortaea acidophila]